MADVWNTDIIIRNVMADVDRQYHEEGRRSYYALVPEQYQAAIAQLVTNNFDYYAGLFGNDRNAFREQMARNWLVKRKAFATLVQRAGLRPVRYIGFLQVPRHRNDAFYAILTRNASYLLVGPGAFDRSGPGAAFRYCRIPLRQAEKVSNMERRLGFYFKKPPRIGDPALTTEIMTSPIVSLYMRARAGPQAVKLKSGLTDTLDQTFIAIDTLTGLLTPGSTDV